MYVYDTIQYGAICRKLLNGVPYKNKHLKIEYSIGFNIFNPKVYANKAHTSGSSDVNIE